MGNIRNFNNEYKKAIFIQKSMYELLLDKKIVNKDIVDIFNCSDFDFSENYTELRKKFNNNTLFSLNEINNKTNFMLGIDKYVNTSYFNLNNDEIKYIKLDIDTLIKEPNLKTVEKYYEIINTPDGVLILFEKGFHTFITDNKDNIVTLLENICKVYYEYKMNYSIYLNTYLETKSNLFNLELVKFKM